MPAGSLLDAVDRSGLEKEIHEIERLSLEDLRTRWRNVSGRLATTHLSRGLLARILAYRIQAEAFGDLDRTAARALARRSDYNSRERPHGEAAPKESGDYADGSSTPRRQASAPLILKPGTLLTREWQGRMEKVMVVADGFAWNGKIFASLSAVARAITGTKWNGHRFFGVRPQDRTFRSSKGTDDPTVQPEGGGKVRTTGAGEDLNRFSQGSTASPRARGATL